MKINNKNFQDWTEEDLKVLLHNDAYRENNFIDYRLILHRLNVKIKTKRRKNKPI